MILFADLAAPWWWLLPIGTALLGALIGLGANVYLRLREERREARAAARLVDAELMVAVNGLSSIHREYRKVMDKMTRGEVPADDDFNALRAALDGAEGLVSAEAWRESRFRLARHVDFEAWEKLRQAYAVLELWLRDEDRDARTEMGGGRAAMSMLVTTDVFSSARAICQQHADMPPAQPPLSTEEQIVDAVGLAEEELKSASRDLGQRP